MRFARLGAPGAEIPVVLDGERTLDLRPVTADIDGAFLADGGVGARARGARRRRAPRARRCRALRVGAPIARPSAVYCIGMNYAAHAAESGSAPPEQPRHVPEVPEHGRRPVRRRRDPPRQHEDRLGGRARRRHRSARELPRLPRRRAGRTSPGFVIANDLSERDWQLAVSGGQWSKGKSAPGFCPTGPWLVTGDEVDADDVRLRSFVNGEPRQDSRTSDLIFGVDTIVWHLSQLPRARARRPRPHRHPRGRRAVGPLPLPRAPATSSSSRSRASAASASNTSPPDAARQEIHHETSDFTGLVAIVTGGASGIGAAIAEPPPQTAAPASPSSTCIPTPRRTPTSPSPSTSPTTRACAPASSASRRSSAASTSS